MAADNVIDDKGIGFFSNTYEQLLKHITILINDYPAKSRSRSKAIT